MLTATYPSAAYLGLVVHEGHGAGTTMEPVLVGSHEDAWAASGAVLAGTSHLARIIDAVVLEHTQLDVLVLVFVLLGLGVGLFLALLSTTIKAAQELKASSLLHAEGGQQAVLLELLAAVYNAALLGGEACMQVLGLLFLLQSTTSSA